MATNTLYNHLIKVDAMRCKEKPKDSAEVAHIRNRLKSAQTRRVSTLELKKLIENGHTIMPADSKGIKACEWIASNSFWVDIDNANEGEMLLMTDIHTICAKYNLYPSIIVNTFSSSDEHPKFRIIFLFEEEYKDVKKRDLVINTLIKCFPQADASCKNADRMFFGTNKPVCYIDENAINTYDNILKIIGQLMSTSLEPEEDVKVAKSFTSSQFNLREEIKNFNLKSYLEKECGPITHTGSNYVMFNYCPICKGHDDLVYYNNNTFTCFGKTGQKTGNIITFLMLIKNLNKSEAVKYFLNTLCGYDIITDDKVCEIKSHSRYKKEIDNLLEKLKLLKTPPESYSQDDKGLSELFATTIKDTLRYNVDRKEWMFFNGKQWKDDTGATRVNKQAKFFKEALLAYTLDANIYSDMTNETQRTSAIDEFRKTVLKLGSKNKRDIIIKDAISEYPIHNCDFDRDTNLLNLQNGTYNLITNKLQPHNADDLLSMVTNVEYKSEASTAFFEKFLYEIFEGNNDKIKYFQRIMGYCLTALTKEETFFILYGPTTRNGKSTLIETILYLFNDYGKQANPETFATRKYNDSRVASGDIARLCNARIVNMPELAKGMMLDVAKVKTLTGGDTVTARVLYQNEFQFKPFFKLFMTTNYLPQVNDNTLFNSNRVNVITFDKHFLPKEQNKELKNKLKEPEIISGIFNWCLKGLNEYRKNGLNPPDCIIKANKEFQAQSDIIGIFLAEMYEKSENSTNLKNAHEDFNTWSKGHSLPPVGKREFNELLKQRKLTATVHGRRNMLKNLTPKSSIIF